MIPVASSQELSARKGIACRGFHLPQESRRRALHRGNFAGQEESLTQQLQKTNQPCRGARCEQVRFYIHLYSPQR